MEANREEDCRRQFFLEEERERERCVIDEWTESMKESEKIREKG